MTTETAVPAPSPSGAVWAGRPTGVPAVVPPPALPLTFLAASALGLVACGVALAWVAPTVVGIPMADQVVAAANFGTLAVLSMGVLGALHQFTPVVTQRPLRSLWLGWSTFAAWLVAAWLVPIGLASRQEAIVAVGGAAATVTVVLTVANLSGPLQARGKGVPVVGLRLAVLGFVGVAVSGITFIADRSGSWFDLAGHTVLAHALIGVFFWLGLVYISVAEKLWPMFLLAHLPGRHRSGGLAVAGTAIGAAALSLGLFTRTPALGWAGGIVLAAGLGCHLVSMTAHIRHRRRRADLHLVFVLTAAVWLVGAAVIGLIAEVAPVTTVERERLVGAAIAAACGWLVTALVGHMHKVVPFIVWTTLRSRGVERHATGRPLLFADLYDHRVATATYAVTTGGIAAIAVGLLANLSVGIAVGGCLLAVAGLAVAANLASTPLVLVARARTEPKAAVPAEA